MPNRKRKSSGKNKFSKLKFLAAVIIFSFLAFYFFILRGLPSPTKLDSPNSFPASTQIFDRHGQLLYNIYVEKNRTPVELNKLPKYVKDATLAAEDKDFYNHKGFAITGILRAGYNIVFRHKLQGGSTISQQLVKNALLTQERTLRRKIREAILTIAIETLYSKDKILEMYLNQIPYGGTAYGIAAASQLYFDKTPDQLTLAEAALLAGLPQSPTRYSPFGAHPELAKQRQLYVLDEMVKDKFISKEEAQKAKEEEIVFAKHGHGIRAPHFVMYVKEQLVDKYGEKMVEEGGLKVYTTLDLELQEAAQTIVATEVAKLKNEKVSNGAALVTDPKTGAILAMVGSKDYFAEDIDGNFNVTTSLLQPGSAIKPINYALALEKKILTPASLILDIPTCFLSAGQPIYCPDNYDHNFHGPVQLRFALGNSYNVPAVKTLALNGLNDFIATASAMGITTFKDPKNYGLSLTLGGGEVKMTDMAVAYGVFANQGLKHNLYAIEKVEDARGKILEKHQSQEGERVLSSQTAYLISHILLDNNARQPTFGPSSYLVVKNHPEVSVKTGTTNEKKDNWTIGFTPSFVVAVWVGNNDRTPMSAIASGVTGASPIWNRIFSFILARQDKEFGKNKQEWPIMPDGIIGVSVCALSGLLPGDSGCPVRYEYFIKGTEPTETESLKRNILVNKASQTPIEPGQNVPLENTEMQEHQVLSDITGSIFCMDCPISSESAVFTSSELKK